jgi:hypothetical protein
MAEKPFRITDRRSSTGYVNNSLIEAATQTTDRKAVPQLDHDVHRTVTSFGRRLLMTLGRHMFWRFPALQGSILEQANLAVESYLPQFKGRDKQWGEEAEALLTEWHKIMDVAGWPYDYDTFVQGKVINPIVDGEDYTLLTETPDGYPLIQIIPAHRIGGRHTARGTAQVRFTGKQMLVDGIIVDANRPSEVTSSIEFEAAIVDGVILDHYARALAYRVFDDSTASAVYQDISARNIFPSFLPMIAGQVRGFSLLASSVFDWQDLHEWGRFEMLAQKVAASQTLVEYNEAGEADTAKALLAGEETHDETTGAKTAPELQYLDGGTIKYFKSMSGGKIESFAYDRPGMGSQNFINGKLRDAFRGTEWDIFFSLDPSKVGGASMRVIVEKINATLRKKRKTVFKACRRVDGYAIARFMKLGLLPWNEEWYKWEYQGPGEVTADKKYDSDVALQEISQGITTRKKVCAARGDYMEEVDDQREREADSDLTRAARLAKKHGITIQEALVVLRPPSVSAQMPQPQQKPATAPEPGSPAE